MVLTRQKSERLVLDLYYNQGKNTREIAQEVKISFKDIGAILKRAVKEKEKEQSASVSSQAYKLFSESKSPIQVAIELNLREIEVAQYYKEYWNLSHLHDLNRVYEEIKDDIYSFVKLYKLAKAAGMNTQHVVNILKIANNHLPAVEHRYENLKRQVYSLEGDKRNSAMILQELSDQISELSNTRDSYRSSCEIEKRQMGELHQKMMKLETFVDDFQNNDEEYIKIIKSVEEKVLGIVSDVKVLLRYALLSITESARNKPEIYRLIFYNMLSQEQHSSQDHNTETNAAIIIDEAEKLFYKLIKDCVNKTVANLKTTNVQSDNESPS